MGALATPGPDLDVRRALRIGDLQEKLAARDGKPGFTRNVAALRAEIARLQSGGPLE